VLGKSVFHEFRLGWLDVSGGQVSANRGDDFASRVGLQGVAPTGADSGYPQVSTRGMYSVFGDPASFVSRRNQHFEIYSNVLVDRDSHRLKFGGYLYHLQFRPEQPDNARGTFAYTGQFTGDPLADFLLGYPTSASVGTGRGEQDARTTWFHAFVQDDWRVGANLTVNLGLRYDTTSTCAIATIICRQLISPCLADGSSLPPMTTVRSIRRHKTRWRGCRSRMSRQPRLDGTAGCSKHSRCAWRREPAWPTASTTGAVWCAAATASS
jgi:hypothetical protein